MADGILTFLVNDIDESEIDRHLQSSAFADIYLARHLPSGPAEIAAVAAIAMTPTSRH